MKNLEKITISYPSVAYSRLKEIAHGIAYVARKIFQAFYQCMTFPCRYLGAKTWSIPGIIIRTPYLIFKRIFGFPVSKQDFFGAGHHTHFQKQLSKEEANELMPYVCITAFGYSGHTFWLEPFGYMPISPKALCNSCDC